jgi:hypothetical protein
MAADQDGLIAPQRSDEQYRKWYEDCTVTEVGDETDPVHLVLVYGERAEFLSCLLISSPLDVHSDRF